jgi:tRNA(Ile)-lysidine synthase
VTHKPQTFSAERLLQVLQSLPTAGAYIVGYSGGADSTALLHALSVVRDQLEAPVSAVHVNHGLHDDAEVWQSRCETFCRKYGVELISLNIKLEHGRGKGLEAEARRLRYEAISELLTPGACLLTAHHADDQAETLLLNLMRGSGIDGLSAMPESRQLGTGLLQRPLLDFQSLALRDYLRKHHIAWSEDPSNQHLNHDRNYVRHEIIPLLEQRWPEVSKRLLLTRKAMTGARHLLEKLADAYLEQHLDHPFVLSLTPGLFDSDFFKLVLRRWIKLSGASSIPVYRLETLCQQVQGADSNHHVSVSWDGWLLHLYQQKLWLCSQEGVSACPSTTWIAGCTEIDLGSDVGRLALKHSDGTGEPDVPLGNFSVACRSNTPDATISHGGHHKSLKKLFQAASVPPWLRDCIPLCRFEDELVAIGDWCFSEKLTTWMSKNNVSLSWMPGHPLLQYLHGQQHPGDR